MDYAEEKFLKEIPLIYVLTVTTVENEEVNLKGLFIGRDRKLFEEAVELSQQKNLIFLDKPIKRLLYIWTKENSKAPGLAIKLFTEHVWLLQTMVNC